VALHLGASVVIAQLLIPLGLSIGQHSSNAMLGVLVAFVIPTLTYILLAAVWLVRLTARMMSAYR
jgi:hypothetical protein